MMQAGSIHRVVGSRRLSQPSVKPTAQTLAMAIKKCVSRHELPQKGAYGRWLWEGGVWGDGGAPRALGKNPYGCADAANILYTVNDFDCDEETCRTRIRELQVMQDPETGMFTAGTAPGTGAVTVTVEETGESYPCEQLGEQAMLILEAGGIKPLMRARFGKTAQ